MAAKRTLVSIAAAAVIALAAVVFISNPPANEPRSTTANHVASVTYIGTHDGDIVGPVEFDVSADGSGITRFRAAGLPGKGFSGAACPVPDQEENFDPAVAITGHAFSFQQQLPGVSLSFAGTFPASGSAAGTLQVAVPHPNPFETTCDTGVLNWTAAIEATPTPSPSPTPVGQTPTPTPTPTPVGQTPSPTPTPTLTPTPTPVGQTPSPTPTPTTAPTATPTTAPGQQVTWADNNCKDGVNPVDSLLALRADAGLSANTGDCPPMGANIDVLLASLHIWGDVDCKDGLSPVDSLKILRYDAGLSVSQEAGCPAMGSAVTIVEL